MLRYIPILVFAVLLALLFAILLARHDDDSPMVGANVPPLALESFDGKPITPDFAGKTHLISFYASWCVPCLAEHPVLMQLKNEGISIIGIGWRDNPEKLSRWLDSHGNPYALTTVDPKSEAAISMGITGVPESFLISRDGVIIKHWRGPLSERDIEYIKQASR